MATNAPLPRLQFIGADALPIVGGLLYTFDSGTATPALTFADASEATPNANPVVLDTTGSAAVFLTAGKAYRFELHDADDALLWTQDNVVGPGLMAAQSSANVSITGGSIAGVSLSGTLTGTATNVTGVVSVINGGTNATTAAGARASLGAAASGANTDITGLAAGVTVGGVKIGYLNAPQTAVSIAYTLTTADAGKHIASTGAGNIVIPANSVVPFEIGTIIGIYNDNSLSKTITITSDTLRLAGTASTGSRTLAAYGYASLLKVAATVWVITGAGVT